MVEPAVLRANKAGASIGAAVVVVELIVWTIRLRKAAATSGRSRQQLDGKTTIGILVVPFINVGPEIKKK